MSRAYDQYARQVVIARARRLDKWAEGDHPRGPDGKHPETKAVVNAAAQKVLKSSAKKKAAVDAKVIAKFKKELGL